MKRDPNASLRYAVETIKAIIENVQPVPHSPGEYLFATSQIFGYRGNTGSAAVGLLQLMGYLTLENSPFVGKRIRLYRITEEKLTQLKKLVEGK